MTIALLSFEYPPETGFGGIGTYTRCQARALAALGEDVEVLAGGRAPRRLEPQPEDGFRLWRVAEGGPARRALALGLAALGLGWTRRRIETALDMRAGLRALARRGVAIEALEAPDSGAEGLLLPPSLARRRLLRVHSPAAAILPFYETSPLDRRLAVRLERRAAAHAASASAPTRFAAGLARGLLGVTTPVAVVPYPVETVESAERATARAALGLPAGRRLVLFAGRLERRKGFAIAIEAMLRLLAARPEVDFACVGEDLFGALAREALPRFAAAGLAARLRAPGRLAPEPLALWRAAADVALVPSLWDNAPYTLLEAMAAGLPAVATAVGGIPEIAEDGREALLVAPGDAPATAAALERLLADADLATALATAGRARVARDFAPPGVGRRSLALYRALAAPREDAG